MREKKTVMAVEGWFSADADEPRLLGTRCRACGTYFFPRETTRCRNPRCASSELDETPLSPRGRLWSFTNACYQPPEPYLSPTPFVPYAVAAVELEAEKMVVLGQVDEGFGVDDLEVGMPMRLVVGTLHEDDERRIVTWKWRPDPPRAGEAGDA